MSVGVSSLCFILILHFLVYRLISLQSGLVRACEGEHLGVVITIRHMGVEWSCGDACFTNI